VEDVGASMSFVRILSACVRIRNWFMVLEMAYIVHLHSVRAAVPLFSCFGYVQSLFGRKKRLLVYRLATLAPQLRSCADEFEGKTIDNNCLYMTTNWRSLRLPMRRERERERESNQNDNCRTTE
jgi:hypothetical protein